MEKFTFFWNGPFSQWHPSPFEALDRRFTCAEQFMMYCKADAMEDFETAEKIMQTSDPKQQKALGRQVKNFDVELWENISFYVVSIGSVHKFQQNPVLLEELLATKGTTLVEASPYDKIWGIGLAANDPRALDRTKWLGENRLGNILTQVRDKYEWKI